MTRARAKCDGLPHRVYERRGTTTYSIGHKGRDGKWSFRLKCLITDKKGIEKLRREASGRALAMGLDGPELETVSQLITDWLQSQAKLPQDSARKRKASTMAENIREAAKLNSVFGAMAITDMQPHHAYTYLDRCDELGRGPKGNKEISLFSVIMNRAVRKGILNVNLMANIEKLPTSPGTRYVEDSELELALSIGRRLGGASLIVALALQAAYLCVRRSVEVRDLQQADISEKGIMWIGGKRSPTDFERRVVIEWSPELRALIDEALTIKRRPDSSSYVFGNLQGQRYTKGGWKSNLGRLMQACISHAQAHNIQFEAFNLQDLRPKAVSDKLSARHLDVVDATLHTSSRMVDQVYDRRRTRIAQPTR